MVAVENRDELPFGIFQRIVDVTGLSVFMRGTGDVLNPYFVRELAELGAATVIEDQILILSFGQSIPSAA